MGRMLVRDNRDRMRFELWDDDSLGGFIDYRVRNGQFWLVHTEINESHEGSGAASFLVRKTLDALRERERMVVPTCPYVAGWIRRHEEYADLVDHDVLRAHKRSRHRGRRSTAAPGAMGRTGP